jgi:hypothetical protein
MNPEQVPLRALILACASDLVFVKQPPWSGRQREAARLSLMKRILFWVSLPR